MKRTVRRAARGDLPIIMRLIEDGKAIMRRNGNMLQWSDGYPQKEVLLRDIDRGQSFLLMDHEGTDSGPSPHGRLFLVLTSLTTR